jgi:hypothetical protein
MNDADNTQNQGLTTEQIAAAGSGAPQEDIPASAGYDRYDDGHGSYDDDNAAPLDADLTASGYAGRGVPDAYDGGRLATGPGPVATGPGPQASDPGLQASLLDEGEQQSITMRWKDIQAEFVDEPTKAIQEADALVAELMQRLATMFAAERSELENRWAGGNQVSTEELRQGLRLYRSFFERLLAA